MNDLFPATAPTLRPYQHEAVERIGIAFADGKRSPLLVLPTGGGKTVVAAELIRRAVDAGEQALFLAPRRELVKQASDKLGAVGVRHGVLLAGADRHDAYARVQVASVDTLASRLGRGKLKQLCADLVIVDEAHLSITPRKGELLRHWPDARLIGLTATPTRKDGRALGALYDALLEPTTTAKLTEEGFLAPARYFSLSEPDLARVRTTAGDYNAKDLNAAVNRRELVGDVVETWLRRAGGRRTVVFCCSIDHSAAMAESFLREGIAAEHVDANTPQADREATFARFASGATQVLTNCMLASYGFDLPELSCVVVARPTKSLMLWLQMIGRGLRIAPGKSDCLVLDHSGCVHRHGFAQDERSWTLDGQYAIADRDSARPERERKAPRRIDCPECSQVFEGTRACPECGYYLAPLGREIETLDGELVEVGKHLTEADRERLAFFLELRGYAAEKSYKPGWSAHKYCDKFGGFPPREWWRFQPAKPSIETRRWIKGQMIRWFKSRERERRAIPS